MRIYRHSPSTGPTEPAEPQEPNCRAKLLSAVNRLPPLATVLNQLLLMLNDANISSGQIAAVIEKDSVLSGSVLRCVNSAYYGLPQRISSIRQAVTLLGFAAIRNLALAFSMRRMLAKAQSPSKKLYASYSQHALGCAVMTQFLAHYTRSEDLDAAFAAGLFHDIGKLLVITTLPEMLPQVVARWEQDEVSFEDAELEILGVTHSELSGSVLEKWQLPDCIQNAVKYHHDPSSCPAEPGFPVTLAHLVYAADAYVRAYGLEVLPSPQRPPEAPDEAFELIGLQDKLPEFFERFRAEFNSIRMVFQGQ